jgi:hypothetical protein
MKETQFGDILTLNSSNTPPPPPHPLVNNIFCFIFGGKNLQVGGSFWKEIFKIIQGKNFEGGHLFF